MLEDVWELIRALAPLACSVRKLEATASFQLPPTTRGPADERAPYQQWSTRGRWVMPLGATTKLEAGVFGFHDWRTRGTPFNSNRTNGADASLRLIGQGDWLWRRSVTGNGATLRAVPPVSTPAGRSRLGCFFRIRCRRMGWAATSRCAPPISRAIELRLGADARRTTGETKELSNYVMEQPTRRRRAGGEPGRTAFSRNCRRTLPGQF